MIVYNFCAGPAMLPKAVLKKAQAELLDWQGLGCSVMEISHRSKEFIAVYEQAIASIKKLMNIPDNYSVLFMHGGGRGQFSAVPLNLFTERAMANYFTTGSWSSSAVQEANKFGNAKEYNLTYLENGLTRVKPFIEWPINEHLDYVHYCPNETVDGIEIFEQPVFTPHSATRNHTIVADFSSTILSREINVADYDLIYAGAQKNIGPSGLSLVIVNNALLKRSQNHVPSIMNYSITAEKGSMFNTPPTYAIYLAKLVFDWLLEQGGIKAIEKKNIQKSALLYKTIDQSKFFSNSVHPNNRSRMNVPFTLKDPKLDDVFLTKATERGLVGLKGHRSVGGMRASIYNAMPLEGVQALVDFMKEFETSHSNSTF